MVIRRRLGLLRSEIGTLQLYKIADALDVGNFVVPRKRLPSITAEQLRLGGRLRPRC
jgi:hypothetical protein